MSEHRERFRKKWNPAMASAIVLLVGSAIPLPERYNPDFGFYGPDKLLHIIGHASFVALLGTAAGDDDRIVENAFGVIAVSTGFGIAIEVLQESVPGREFEFGDIVAGLLGSLIGLVAFRQ